MPASSLLELALKECVKNVQSITNVGSLEYETVRSLLLKVDSPEQLREIENYSPQIIGQDEELWIRFFKRDAPGWEQKPRNGPLCYETYQEAVAQSKEEVANDERILKAKMDEIKAYRSMHTSKQVSAATVPRLPKMGGIRYLGCLKQLDENNDFQYYQPRKPRSEPKSKLTFGSGSRMKARTGREMMNKARKEVQEQSLLRGRLAVPTHQLQQRATQVRHAPYSLVADHVKPAVARPIDPTIKPAEVFVPKRKRVVAEEESAESEPSSANDEERPIQKKPKTASASAASSHPAEKVSSTRPPPPPPALANNNNNNNLPPTQPFSATGKPVRPPMKAKRPVNIFLPPKRR